MDCTVARQAVGIEWWGVGGRVDRRMQTLRYSDDDRRDHRLDWLRGFALFAMSVNHFGLDRSVFHVFTGGSVFLINAAEGFFFVSGLTLGVISRRQPLDAAVGRTLRRAWHLYLVVVAMALGAALGGRLGLADEDGGGATFVETRDFLVHLLALRIAPFWTDILVAYILYLLAGGLLIWALARGRTLRAGLVLLGGYFLGPLGGDGPSLGFPAFRSLFASAPLFLGGMMLGWHREWISEHWRRWPGSVIVDAVTMAVAVALLAEYIMDFRHLPWLGDRVGDAMAIREYEMPPLHLALVVLYLRAFWLLVDRGWAVLRWVPGVLMLPLGRASLFTFAMHAAMMPITWLLAGAAGSGERGLRPEDRAGATAITALYLGLIYASVGVRWAYLRWLQAGSTERRVIAGWTGPILVGVMGVLVLVPWSLDRTAWGVAEDGAWARDEQAASREGVARFNALVREIAAELDEPEARVVVAASGSVEALRMEPGAARLVEGYFDALDEVLPRRTAGERPVRVLFTGGPVLEMFVRAEVWGWLSARPGSYDLVGPQQSYPMRDGGLDRLPRAAAGFDPDHLAFRERGFWELMYSEEDEEVEPGPFWWACVDEQPDVVVMAAGWLELTAWGDPPEEVADLVWEAVELAREARPGVAVVLTTWPEAGK